MTALCLDHPEFPPHPVTKYPHNTPTPMCCGQGMNGAGWRDEHDKIKVGFYCYVCKKIIDAQ